MNNRHFIEALARRAQGHEGEARRLLDARLAQLLAATDAQSSGSAQDQAPIPAVSGLSSLVASMARAEDRRPALQALAYFRSTWSRLSAERRLTESLSDMPDNAGPLNSHHLAHRALVLMRDVSPQYLSRFLSHVDALMWLEQAQLAVPTARGDAGRKAGRGRAG